MKSIRLTAVMAEVLSVSSRAMRLFNSIICRWFTVPANASNESEGGVRLADAIVLAWPGFGRLSDVLLTGGPGHFNCAENPGVTL